MPVFKTAMPIHVLTGRSGSGKSTLAPTLGYDVVVNTDIGEVKDGHWVRPPDPHAVRLQKIQQILDAHAAGKKVLVEGHPYGIERTLKNHMDKVEKIFFKNVPKKVSLDRVRQRAAARGSNVEEDIAAAQLSNSQLRGAMRRISQGKPVIKLAKVVTKLQPHQQRVIDRLKEDDQPGLLVAHGLGSGKTLTSIAAQDALGMESDVVVPAALQANYKKELKKHVEGRHPKAHVQSMQNVAVKGTELKRPMLVVDEAHRAREPGTKTYQTLSKNTSKKRLLLTGSPFYNRPNDIAPLINLAAGNKLLPTNRADFEDRYVLQLQKNPGLIARLRGVKPGTTPVLHPKRKEELKNVLQKWTDYYEGAKENYPEVKREDVKVPMTDTQLEYYDTMMNKAPFWVRYKVKKGLPPTKSEAGDLNAFLGGVRQVSNSTRPYHAEGPDHKPKIIRAYGELKKTLDENPRAKAVVYSNYLDAGITPYKQLLDQGKIPYGEFTGQMGKKQRDALVKDYNENKIRALLLSSAGGEGLDLKGTRLMQIMEPHWNSEKLRQVEGRGIRFGSHSDLPPEERNVRVQRYMATRPAAGLLERMHLKSPGMGVDEYLSNMSEDKERLNHQFRELLKRDQAKS